MRPNTSILRIGPAALALLALLAACDKPKARNVPPDQGGPLNAAAGQAAPPPARAVAAAEPALSNGLSPRPEFPGFYLDHIGPVADPLKNPAVVPATAAIVMDGFGFDSVAMAPAKGVDLQIDRDLYGTTYGSARPDVATAKKVPALAATGYKTTLPAGTLKPGPHQVVVRVISADGQGFYQSPVISFTVR